MNYPQNSSLMTEGKQTADHFPHSIGRVLMDFDQVKFTS